MKTALTPAGIEPATFRFVAQLLNHCATAIPPHYAYASIILQTLYLNTWLQGTLAFNITVGYA